jgi:hypothetical protein
MKRFLLFIACAMLSTASFAQFTGLEVEVYQVHDGSIPELDGMTTYRLYANFADPDDFVSAMSGLQGEPLKIRTSTSFFQLEEMQVTSLILRSLTSFPHQNLIHS